VEKNPPTPRELQILKVLWEHGPSSVKDVHRRLASASEADRDLAYNTVQTLLRIMEDPKKDLVRHKVEGRTFIYWPITAATTTAGFSTASLTGRRRSSC
jgi:predicted transcriptional regulator